MDKLSGLSHIAAILRNSQTSLKSKKTEGTESKAATERSGKVTLNQVIQSQLVGLNDFSDESIVEVFVKGTLCWEFGDEIPSDPSYATLVDKLVADIEHYPAIKSQVLTLVKALR